MRWIAYCTLAAVACVPFAASAQGAPAAQPEAALVKRATELREQPGESQKSLGPLAAQTTVTRSGERNGAWVQVRTAQGATGWLHIFDLTSPNAPSQGGNAATGAFRGLTGMFGGGSAPRTTTATSTIGIRGLGAEDIANAQPNPAAVSQAEGLRQDAGQAQQFASVASLTQRPLVVLPEPPRPASGGNAGGRSGGTPGNPGMAP